MLPLVRIDRKLFIIYGTRPDFRLLLQPMDRIFHAEYTGEAWDSASPRKLVSRLEMSIALG